MCFKRKPRPTNDAKVLENAEVINANVKALRGVLVQLEGNADVYAKLSALCEKYKYASPSEAAAYLDNRIRGRINDMKTAAEAALKSNDFAPVEDLIIKIRALVEER
ncbi:MAG: hypothetical protein LBS99_06455 [Clostridiales bacterium]|jgi:hypothetical protein|nr:hypothetical protein [Clostridiales bacterium]